MMLRITGLKLIHVLAAAAVFGLPCAVSAELFYPAVPVHGVEGNVTVKVPGAPAFARASDGIAQPFGTLIKTGSAPAASIALASDVKATLDTGSTIRVNLAGGRKERAVISLLSGGATITIKEGAAPPSRSVELLWQGGSITFPKDGEFTFALSESAGTATLSLTAAKGAARFVGMGHSGVVAMKDVGVVLESNHDLSHNRVQGTKESFVVSILTSHGQPRDITIEEDAQIKVYRKVLPRVGAAAVSILEIQSDGSIVKTESYTQFMDEVQVRSLKVDDMALEVEGVNLGDVND